MDTVDDVRGKYSTHTVDRVYHTYLCFHCLQVKEVLVVLLLDMIIRLYHIQIHLLSQFGLDFSSFLLLPDRIINEYS